MTSFSIIVHGAPYSSQASQSALTFSHAVIENGDSIYRLFFYQDGVHNASSLCVPPQDENNIPLAWQKLIQAQQIDAVVCVASAIKRGIVNAEEAERYALASGNVLEGFVVSGLGQLVDASLNADRIIHFYP